MTKQDLWDKAIQQLDPDDRDKIPSNDRQVVDLETVLSSAQSKQKECERKHWKYKKRDGTEVELRQVFGRVVQRLLKFKTIGDAVAAIDPTHLGVPWAAVSLALQLAVSDSESYQTVFEGIETFSGLVPRYALFEQLYLNPNFPLQDSLEQALVKLYATALKYLIKAKEYYATRTIKRVAKSLIQAYGEFDEWMGEIREQQRIADELARLIDAHASRHSDEKLDSITSEQGVLLEGLKEFKAPIQVIQDGLVDLVNSWTQREREAQASRILTWLSPLSPVVFHKQRLEARLQGSGQWVFENKDYIKWRVSSESAVLWLHGLPGTGKSTLMSTIISSLQADHAHAPGGLLAYTFCSRNRSDPRWQDPGTLVRSLIAQLARPEPSVPLRGEVIRAYENLVQKEGDTAVAEGAGLLWNDATQLLLQLIDQGTTTICIDAMDECAEESRDDFLALIDRLLTRVGGGRVKILISSRPSLDIAERFSSWSCYSLDAGQNGADIQAYARDQTAKCLEAMRRRSGSVSAELEDELTQHLVEGAQGMFLWVELRAKMLLRQSGRAIFEGDLLQPSTDLPQPLSRLFGDIYDRILTSGSQTYRTALTMFQWLLCAQGAVPAEDLVQALSLYIEGGYVGPGQQDTGLTVSTVLDSCQDLVVIDQETDELRFVHTAVRDFLERKDGLQPTDQHSVVAELCLATVQSLASAPPTKSSLTRNSFHYYVVLYWASHVAQAGPKHRTESIHDALQDLCQERPWFQSWLPQIQPASSLVLEWNDPHKDKIMQALSSPATSFFTACAFGFTEVAHHCIQSHSDVIHKRNDLGTTGLHIAAEYGHQEIVEALCRAGANVNSLDSDGETPLVRAAAGGNKALVLMLLEAGVSKQIQDQRYGTALHAAALHGHLDVLQVLLQHGADLAAADGQFGTALHAACLRGHVRVVRFLLDAGADINAAASETGTQARADKTTPEPTSAGGALRAIELVLERRRIAEGDSRHVSHDRQQEQTLQLLLDHEVDLNILPRGFGSPLHIAARAGHDAVVNALLSHPAVHVNLEGGDYGSALQAAAVAGRASIVQRLLDAKADVNMQAGRYGTALTAACRQADLGLAELLLQSGAAVNVQVGVYGTALQAACRGGSHLLVQRLLDAGADVNLTGGNYCTALQAAARDGYEQIVRRLLQRGANVHVKGGVFGSALQAAAVGGHQRVVEMLWEANAEVGDGLQYACLGGHQPVAQYLLDHGCDLNGDSDSCGTAIQAALAGQHHSLVDWLLNLGASFTDFRGRFGTVLQLAAWAGKEDLASRCLKRGVDPWQENPAIDMEAIRQLGCTLPPSTWARRAFPIVFAAAGGHSQVVTLLLDAPRPKPISLADGDDTLRSNVGFGLDSALRVALETNQEAMANLLLLRDFSVECATVECACAKSEPSLVVSLLERCPALDRHGDTVRALSVAASHRRTELVEVLLPRVVESKKFVPTNLATALRNAVTSGDLEIVNHLLDSGASPTFQSHPLPYFPAGPSRTASVLPAAVAGGHSHIVRALLDRNTQIDIVEETHGTALQAAAYAGDEDIVIDLLNHGADLNVEGGTYGTAVQAAVAGGHEAIVKRLITLGADLRCQGGRPENWKSYSTRFKWRSERLKAVTKRYKRLTQEFKQAAETKPVRRQSGLHGTALQAAAVTGSAKMAAMLVEAGADINDVDCLGQTPLHRAAYYGHYGVATFLVSKGAMTDAIDCHGRSPMLLAAIGGHQAIFAYLFALAPRSEAQSAAKGQPRALHLAARHGHIGILEHLVAAQIDLEQANTEGQTALLIAAACGRCSTVRFLLDNGSDIHRRDNFQQTALFLAAHLGHDDVVRLLLASGADSLALNREGESVLHVATLGNHLPVAYLLAEHGTPPLDLRDNHGTTALHLAVRLDRSEMIVLLLGKGADVHAVDSDGKTPLDICNASTTRNDWVRNLLVQHGAKDRSARRDSGSSELDSDTESEPTLSESEYETKRSGLERGLAWQPELGRLGESSSSGGRRTMRNERKREILARAGFTERPGLYRSDEEYSDSVFGKKNPAHKRYFADRYEDEGDSSEPAFDGRYDDDSDDDAQDGDGEETAGVGDEAEDNDLVDQPDAKEMITMMIKWILILVIMILVIVLVAVLAMAALMVMMMVMVMCTTLSLMVMKWMMILWP